MDTQTLAPIKQFRQELYNSVGVRADATLDLMDALSTNTTARSVVELSLSPLFRRAYSSLHDAVDSLFQASSPRWAWPQRRELEQADMQLIGRYLPRPVQRSFWLIGQDATPYPRLHAPTLTDRGFVYQPTVVKRNAPVTIGHQYAVLAVLPEKAAGTPPWVVPLSLQRIPTARTEIGVGAEMLNGLMQDPALPFHAELTVDVVDAKYGVAPFLGQVAHHPNLVVITRSRGNRVFYRPAPGPAGCGHPTWYGERFALREPDTWGPPQRSTQFTRSGQRGQVYTVVVEAWDNLRMRGQRDLPMHTHPFSLARVRLLDAHGRSVFARDLWLIVLGHQRGVLSLLEIAQAYQQRYDLEHFFRFGKQRLLLDRYQTPCTEHEENWVRVVKLTYVQLWLISPLVNSLPRPWEIYSLKPTSAQSAPALTLRGAERIIRQIGTPAAPPKRRGKSPGRRRGATLPRRKRLPVVKKTKKGKKTPQPT
jgi:hypothetical protein